MHAKAEFQGKGGDEKRGGDYGDDTTQWTKCGSTLPDGGKRHDLGMNEVLIINSYTLKYDHIWYDNVLENSKGE